MDPDDGRPSAAAGLQKPKREGTGIGTMVLGVVVAVAVALLFIVVMGADRARGPAGAGYRARPHLPGEIQAAPAASRSSRMPIQSSR